MVRFKDGSQAIPVLEFLPFYVDSSVESICMRLFFSFVSKADVIGCGMKGRIWLTKASRFRSSVWRVGGKRPGYNASDSESDEEEDS
ncbi:hypothetical protein GmHk_18G051147 [Glycine max]|nr:hypothetical protein GmHk_18G051147 [Glycine max]